MNLARIYFQDLVAVGDLLFTERASERRDEPTRGQLGTYSFLRGQHAEASRCPHVSPATPYQCPSHASRYLTDVFRLLCLGDLEYVDNLRRPPSPDLSQGLMAAAGGRLGGCWSWIFGAWV